MTLNQIIDYLKLHWASVVVLAGVVWNYASPTVTNYVANHPHLSFWYGLAAVIITFYSKSPLPPAPSITSFPPKP